MDVCFEVHAKFRAYNLAARFARPISCVLRQTTNRQNFEIPVSEISESNFTIHRKDFLCDKSHREYFQLTKSFKIINL